MNAYAIRRILRGFVTLFVSITITFLILRLMPGNPADLVVEFGMTAEMRESILRDFGLDKPVGMQYLIYLKQLAVGNMGTSFRSLTPVSQLLMERLPMTLILTISAYVITLLVGLPLGIVAAVKKGGVIDWAVTAGAILGNSIFIPWLGIMLLYIFGYRIGWFPIGGAMDIGAEGLDKALSLVRHLVLPVATLVCVQISQYVLFLRTGMVDVLQEDYIRTANAKGLSNWVVLYKHALKNAFIPALTMMGLQMGFLVGGAVLTETVFSYPGIGRLIYESVLQLDYPVLQGAFIVLAATVLVANIITDLCYGLLDPRIRYN
ncbi:MAG: ABC transporter permease [Anaerolineales bacterium]|nr:ABC transporter permease [Anaerolineales bacterium]